MPQSKHVEQVKDVQRLPCPAPKQTQATPMLFCQHICQHGHLSGASRHLNNSCISAGFRQKTLPRVGKLPPEPAWVLDNDVVTLQNVMHTLHLMQSPSQKGMQHVGDGPASAAQAQGDAALATETPLTDATAPVADATSQVLCDPSYAVGQQSQTAARVQPQLPGDGRAPMASARTALSDAGLTVHTAVCNTSKTGIGAVTTPDMSTGGTPAAGDAMRSEAPAHGTPQAETAHSSTAGSQAITAVVKGQHSAPDQASTPATAHGPHSAGTSSESATAVAYRQSARSSRQATPAAAVIQQGEALPVQQQGSNLRIDPTDSVQKAISFTPVLDKTGIQTPTEKPVSARPAAIQGNAASLIKQAFSELMLTGNYTPNEAAVLAVKSVSER